MKKEAKGLRTKHFIYTCAIRLFREYGYDNISVNKIVKQAGVAKGTFYIYFHSKSDIILEMLKQYDDYYDQIINSFDTDTPVEIRLREIVKGACRFTQNVIGLDLIRVLYTKQIASGTDHRGLLNEDRALFRILTCLVAEGQQTHIYLQDLNTEELALLIIRGIRSVFFDWCSSGGDLDLESECLKFLNIFCKGISLS